MELEQQAEAGQSAPAAQTDARLPIRTLDPREARELSKNLMVGERVLAQCVGAYGQALVVTDRKVLIIKGGYMAGAMFGTKVTAYDFRAINAVEIETKLRFGVAVILTPGLSDRNLSYFGENKDDAFQAPNAVPFVKEQADDFERAVQAIRELVRQASLTVDPLEQLAKLAELRESGVVSDAEFETKKKELLSRI